MLPTICDPVKRSVQQTGKVDETETASLAGDIEDRDSWIVNTVSMGPFTGIE